MFELILATSLLAAAPAPSAAGAPGKPVEAETADPTITVAPPLAVRVSLDEALARAAKRNPTALMAEQEIARAEALVGEARSGSLPTLTANATATRLDGNRSAPGSTKPFVSIGSTAANLTVVLPLIVPQRWVAWSHASENVDVSRMSQADVRRSLAVSTARAFLAVVAQQRVLEVSVRAFETARAHYDFAHQRRRGGVGNRLDEVRAQQQMEATRSQAELAIGALRRTQEALGVLLGDEGPVDANPEVTLADPPPMDEAVRSAPSRRTDVQLQSSRLTAAQHVLRDSYADYLPTVTAQGVPFFNDPPTLTQPRTGWQALLVLSFPIYEGGLRWSTMNERESLANEARIALDGALRQAQSDVRTAYEALRRADESLAAARRAAELADQALALANEAYHAGATTNLEVIDAERQARDAESVSAVAEDTARQARVDLLAASGLFP